MHTHMLELGGGARTLLASLEAEKMAWCATRLGQASGTGAMYRSGIATDQRGMPRELQQRHAHTGCGLTLSPPCRNSPSASGLMGAEALSRYKKWTTHIYSLPFK